MPSGLQRELAWGLNVRHRYVTVMVPTLPFAFQKSRQDMNHFRSLLQGILFIAGFMVLASCSQTNNDGKDTIPDGWKVEDIFAPVTSSKSSKYPDIGISKPTAHVLAWKIEQNSDTDSGRAIVWIHYQDSVGKERWILAHVCRPGAGAAGWALIGLNDSQGYHDLEVFEEPPKNKEVNAFLDASRWVFGPTNHLCRVVEGSVCVNAWQQSIGEKPTRSFPK